MNLNALVYRTFCVSLFGFLWQLEDAPEKVMNAEPWALRRFVPGPGNWIRPVDLHHLSDGFGFPFNFQSFEHLALASKMRVRQFEPQVNWMRYRQELLHALEAAPVKRAEWHDWYNNNHVLVVSRSCSRVEECGISASTVQTTLLQTCGQLNSVDERKLYIKRNFQAEVLRQLCQADQYNYEHVLSRKLKRWNSNSIVPEGILVRRSVRLLRGAFAIVPLKVVLVLFRAWFNGWCTARRYQVPQAACLVGCIPGSKPGCHDKIEHYAHCPVVVHFGCHVLQLPCAQVGGLINFLCLGRDVSDESRVLQMLLLYAVYSATNCLRFAKPKLGNADMKEFLLQYLHQGASQSSSAQQVLHNHLVLRRNVRPCRV